MRANHIRTLAEHLAHLELLVEAQPDHPKAEFHRAEVAALSWAVKRLAGPHFHQVIAEARATKARHRTKHQERVVAGTARPNPVEVLAAIRALATSSTLDDVVVRARIRNVVDGWFDPRPPEQRGAA